MRLSLVIALCGCGRFGFDALADSGGDSALPDAPDVGYFVSPTGDNANPGTRAQPWGTLPFAIAQLHAGDTLNLADGDYDATAAVGRLDVDCSAGLANGTAGAPIVVRADHPRKAHLFGKARELYVTNCAYWEFRDLWLEGLDDSADTGDSLAVIYNGADHIVLHGLLGMHPNRYGNNDVFEVDHATNILVEDVEAYEYHRAGVTAFDSTNVTVRRAYCNGRDYPDIAGGYTSACPGGDYCFIAYYTRAGVVEDSISEHTCYDGFGVSAGPGVSGATGVGDDQLFANDIVLGPTQLGFDVITACTSASPCTTPDEVAENNTIRNCVAIDADADFLLQGIGNKLDHVTALGAGANQLVVFSVDAPADPGVSATAFGSAILGTGGGAGATSSNQASWGIDSSNIFNAGTAYSPNDAHVTNSTSVEPGLQTCKVYLPPTSPMVGAGPGGTNIGADLRTMTDGSPFWTASGAYAGCGAIVLGVNDNADTSCIGVGGRLGVGVGVCPAP